MKMKQAFLSTDLAYTIFVWLMICAGLAFLSQLYFSSDSIADVTRGTFHGPDPGTAEWFNVLRRHLQNLREEMLLAECALLFLGLLCHGWLVRRQVEGELKPEG